ncbi:MAG: transcriptional regulator GcvA [Alphaproteobacteria bacterium]|nr:transcriptional regulator GcvA [Alphaproteobacteria bacterium]
MRSLPPLTSLRAFEAAARLESVTRAADELSVTHAAISHQLRALETWIGKPLFERRHRRIQLNEAGAMLLPVVSDAFDRIAERAGRLRSRGERRTLTISAAPSVAYRWVVPRLAVFSEQHPEIDVRLEHSTRMVDLARESIDVAIRYGAGAWPGVVAHRLMSGHAEPLAAPALLDRHGFTNADLPLSAEQISHLPLQHEETRDWWRRWFEANGVPGADVSSGAVFHEAGVLIDVAIAGQGVVLGRWALADEPLRHGLLLSLNHAPLSADMSYWLAYHESRSSDPVIIAFRDYVLEHVASEPPPVPERPRL